MTAREIIRLAHFWKGKVFLTRAVLRGAVLRGADLTGAVLTDADLTDADLTDAVLRGAVLRGADLRGAVLTRAVLTRTDLRGAVLTRAVLTRAVLTDADLTGAVLTRTKIPRPALDILKYQPGKLHAFKIVNEQGEGIYKGGIGYQIGESYAVDDANTDERDDCGAGINVATLERCVYAYEPGYRILVVEFEAADIAAIPYTTDGKFRLHRCTVVGEQDIADFIK